MNELRFFEARSRALSESGATGGIGRLSEKVLHKALKYYVEPNDAYHEVPFLGSVADVKNESDIFEIQTRYAAGLRQKLEKLVASGVPVTVVIPVAARKTVSWIDRETGELTAPRKSPKRETAFHVFAEFCGIAELIKNDGFSFKLLFLDVAEYRNKDGWGRGGKRGSTRAERIPNSLVAELDIRTAGDVAELLPFAPNMEFTAKELKAHTGLTPLRNHSALRFLVGSGAVSLVGKRGKAFVYERR